MSTFVEAILKTPTRVNKDCVHIVNLIRCISLEFLHRIGLYMNETYVPLKDKIVDINYTGTIGKISENAEVFNAFYSCTVTNLKLAGSLYYLHLFGIFERMPTIIVLSRTFLLKTKFDQSSYKKEFTMEMALRQELYR